MLKKIRHLSLWDITKFLLALSLVVFVIKKTDFIYISLLSERLSWTWLTLRVMFFFLLILIKAFQYYALIGNVRYQNVLNIVIWQNAISNFIANSAGIASYMTLLKTQQKVKVTRSGVIFIITKLGDLLAICFYLGLSSILVWTQIQPLHWLTVLLITSILSVLGVFFVTVLWRERFVFLIEQVLSWFQLERVSFITRGLDILHSLSKEDKKPIVDMLKTSIFLSFIYMTASMFFAYTSMMLFNIKIGIWPIIYVASLRQLVSFIPIQVLGGLGVSEVTSVYLYSFFGLDQGEISAVMIGLRALFYIMNALILLYLPFGALIQRYKSKYANK